MMPHWILAGFGGFCGSAGRYLISGAVHRLVPAARFPWGTLVVNLIGCFVIGLLGGLSEQRGLFNSETRTFLMLGVLGGFTTFSSFGYETLQLFRAGQAGAALGNVGLQVLLGLLAAWLGMAFVR